MAMLYHASETHHARQHLNNLGPGDLVGQSKVPIRIYHLNEDGKEEFVGIKEATVYDPPPRRRYYGGKPVKKGG